jgi:hypothetical protein
MENRKTKKEEETETETQKLRWMIVIHFISPLLQPEAEQ